MSNNESKPVKPAAIVATSVRCSGESWVNPIALGDALLTFADLRELYPKAYSLNRAAR